MASLSRSGSSNSDATPVDVSCSSFGSCGSQASVFGRDLERLCGAPRIDRNSNTDPSTERSALVDLPPADREEVPKRYLLSSQWARRAASASALVLIALVVLPWACAIDRGSLRFVEGVGPRAWHALRSELTASKELQTVGLAHISRAAGDVLCVIDVAQATGWVLTTGSFIKFVTIVCDYDRIRRAVVAASDRPDDAFTWLSKVWEKDVKEEDLRDPEGFVTLDAKVLSAVTNILEGAFARQIDTFKEREANGGRLAGHIQGVVAEVAVRLEL
eukprot:s6535_g3.t1